MMKYVIVDGVLQPSTPETARLLQRAGRQVPQREPEDDPVAVDLTDRRSDYQVIEGLDETPEV
jgi:hypothetical protein